MTPRDKAQHILKIISIDLAAREAITHGKKPDPFELTKSVLEFDSGAKVAGSINTKTELKETLAVAARILGVEPSATNIVKLATQMSETLKLGRGRLSRLQKSTTPQKGKSL